MMYPYVQKVLWKLVWKIKFFWMIVGGFYLVAYASWYFDPRNRVVLHWPIDLLVTILSGLLLVYYGFYELLELVE